MPRRYRHYLSRPKVVKWPRTIVCVACDNESHVYVSECTLTDDNTYRHDPCITMTTDQWWKWLARHAGHGSQHWIMSWRCGLVWSRIKLWEGIEDGSVKIVADTDRPITDGGSDMSQVREAATTGSRLTGLTGLRSMYRRPGVLFVCEDPPNICRFRLRSWPAEYTWVDVRNYGVELIACDNRWQQQCHQLTEFVTRLRVACDRLDLGSLRPTAAGQALHGWRRSYMPRGIYAHTHPTALSLERDSSYGGRCECRSIGPLTRPVWHYDIRSSYGRCMAAETVPIRLVRAVHRIGTDQLWRWLDTRGACSRVDLLTALPLYPVRRSGIVIYPTGRYTTTLAGPELRMALERGHVTKVHSAALYDSEPACSEFATCVYAERLHARSKGDALTEQFCKALLVGLVGKLAQQNREWVIHPNPGPIRPYDDWIGPGPYSTETHYRSVGGVCLREVCDGYLPDAIPSIAAHITSAGRMRLLALIEAAGWEHTIYYDTDSIMVDAHGNDAILKARYTVGDGLGDLNLVYQGKDVEIHGVKHYREGQTIKFAGQATGVCVDAGGGRGYNAVDPPATLLRGGRKPAVQISNRQYPVPGQYRHGDVGRDGIVTPFHLEK